MGTALKALKILAGLLVLGIGGLAVYVMVTWNRTYDAPLPSVVISRDPAVLARGEYLVFGPAHCAGCHGSSAATPAALKSDAGDLPKRDAREPLSGGARLALGPLGVIYASNLTPDPDTGIGRYSDAQVARMMRWAVKPDGHATLEPLMPFGNMSDEDLLAVLSYLRAQPPVTNAVPDNEWTLFGKVVKSLVGIFKPRTSIDPPAVTPPAGTTARGEYLARYVANCVGCHTPRSETTFAATGPEFSGGMIMDSVERPGVDMSMGFISSNITPKPGSALKKFPDKITFVARFQRGGRQFPGSPMPWEEFRRMSEEDLGAIYDFLSTLPPQDGPSGEPMVKR